MGLGSPPAPPAPLAHKNAARGKPAPPIARACKEGPGRPRPITPITPANCAHPFVLRLRLGPARNRWPLRGSMNQFHPPTPHLKGCKGRRQAEPEKLRWGPWGRSGRPLRFFSSLHTVAVELVTSHTERGAQKSQAEPGEGGRDGAGIPSSPSEKRTAGEGPLPGWRPFPVFSPALLAERGGEKAAGRVPRPRLLPPQAKSVSRSPGPAGEPPKSVSGQSRALLPDGGPISSASSCIFMPFG